MVRILNVLGSLNFGGIETFLMNLYRVIDRKRFQFDFLVCDAGVGENNYRNEILSLGGKIYSLPCSKSESIVKNLGAVYRIVKENKYRIVWRHTDNAFMAVDLLMARLAGAERTILHSHSTQCPKEALGKFVWFLLNGYAVTERFACGEAAGKWMFGDKPFRIIRNGIDLQRFSFNEEIRKNYRKQFNVEDKFVLGHVGRFEQAKNHKFILTIFEEFHRKNRDSVLVLTGTGTLLEEVKAEAKRRNLEAGVLFLGNRKDVPELMMMMDRFLLPSVYEGFPVTLVEAQTAGLPCIVSDTVTREADITGETVFLSLEEPLEKWAGMLGREAGIDRRNAAKEIRAAGYDSKDTAEMLEKMFERWSGCGQ